MDYAEEQVLGTAADSIEVEFHAEAIMQGLEIVTLPKIRYVDESPVIIKRLNIQGRQNVHELPQ